MAEALPERRHVEGEGGGVDLGLYGFQRQGHVGAGVAVGHRVHVEAVEGGPVGDQGIAVGTHDRGEIRCR